MKKYLLALLLVVELFFGSSAWARNLLRYREVIDIQDLHGTAFLAAMENTIKPALDAKADQGFRVAKGTVIAKRFEFLDKKVQRKALRAAGSLDKLTALADELNATYPKITFYDLPDAIGKAGFKQGRFDLATILSLLSEGGVAVRFDENNISYNVNYGTGENQNDERSGRSFGESFDRMANDASDAHYLETLEEYVRGDRRNVREFYRTVLATLFNSDISNLGRISRNGQGVATDFFAVYIAEQDRHLMSDLARHPWDEALLEVTLLSAFHSGQSRVMIMHEGELKDSVPEQQSGCATESPRMKPASMVDYWQFSNSSDPEHCNRSGINITRRDFRALGAKVTAWQRAANPELVARMEKRLKLRGQSKNLFADLSGFLIRKGAPQRYDRDTLKLVDDFVELLLSVQEQADATTMAITRGEI